MLTQIGIEAKKAAAQVAVLSTDKKNQILQSMADELVKNSKKILDANKVDLDNSKDLGLTPALIDRLTLSEERINGMANGLLKIIPLEDPVGNITDNWNTDEGLDIKKIRSPFGVIGVIYEARPNVTSDVSGLCLKSGNAVILRGSSYCLDSNIAILEVLQEALISNNCNKNIFQIIESKDRQDTLEFMNLTEFVDLIVPRGGKGLIQTLVDNSKVPFILDGDGNVHLYIHEDAKKENIIDIVINSKVQRPGVCNALETLLINNDIYQDIGANVIEALLENEVELFVDEKIKEDFPNLNLANESHYETEFLDLKLAIKLVSNVDDAIEHIRKYSSGHTEAILTESNEISETFAKSIDSSVIFINSSTRFTDGEMFGFGSEIGISTQKLHVRGPMGLEALTNERYVVTGEGTVRE
ncbi:MAG: glutamate-5-semialdehyde dehydrogenase [Candidatus Actinomarina sp.]|tara:strand:- start:55 stop:1296 length:1242 start_codon:yes stop_codon:yes gene_type:complete